MKHKSHPMKWIIWILASIFYFYEFFIRVAPSVMVPELMEVFSVTATAVGTLSGFYFYIYAPMQLPVGVLVDRYGARKLLAFAALIAGIGTFLFALSQSYWIAALGRFCMGLGSSFGFVGMIFICSHWFPEKKRGLMIGLANAIGMIGAIMGEGPLRLSIDFFGWRPTLFYLAVFGIALALIIYLIVRNDPPELAKHDPKVKKRTGLLKNLKEVTSHSMTWVNSFASSLLYLTTSGFAALWSTPFLTNTYGLSIELAGFITSMIFLGWAVGGPIIGIFTDKIKQKKPVLAFSCLGCAATLLAIIYLGELSIQTLFILFFLVGCFQSGQLLNYSYSIDVNPVSAKATAVAFTNFVTVAGGALVQPFTGFLLDFFWSGKMAEGVRVYSATDYRLAMTIFPLASILAFILTLFLKKMHRHKGAPSPA